MFGSRRNALSLDGLLTEASELCARAERVGRETDRLNEAGPEAAVPVAFEGTLAREIRGWLRRAEDTVVSVKTDGDASGREGSNELRRLIDCANVAVLKRSAAPAAWVLFYQTSHQISRAGH
jgi:hypothetical protein